VAAADGVGVVIVSVAPARSAANHRPLHSCYSRHHLQTLLQPPIEPTRGFLCCTLRHKRASELRFSCTQCRLGQREMDEVALGETATAAMRDVTHTL
jgi:hypothetical protein